MCSTCAIPTDPAIAGQLEIPGVSNYLRSRRQRLPDFRGAGRDAQMAGAAASKWSCSTREIVAHPQSLGVKVFGKSGSWSEALHDPHALTFVDRPAPDASLRLVLPIDVYDAPASWTYSGLHVLEVAGTDSEAPQLRFHGLIKTADNTSTTHPPYAFPERGILHDDAVFAVHGDEYRVETLAGLSNSISDPDRNDTLLPLRQRSCG